MICPTCAHENRPGAKFCRQCASPLRRVCASCGAELDPVSMFCDECGAAVGSTAAKRPSESSDARKVVTIVFADLVGSTALHERLDPESARRFMEGYYAAMRGAVESHGGSVTQFLGDGVKAVFGIPRVAEDDAVRAVRAAVAMQVEFRALADPQREAIGRTGLRVAVNTGEVVANDASEIIGDPVNVAARLQEQGRDGDVVVGESTHALVATLVTLEPLGSFALKGRTEAVKAYRVISLERPAGAAASVFVGRDDELARIGAVYETAVTKPATGLAVLLGSPGLGKSRLIDELAHRLGGGATVIRAHCDASGGASFAPLADALRALPDLDAAVPGSDAERARIQNGVRALLAGSPASPEETFFVVRRLLSALAATKPVVLVIDDLHWAEPLLLDLVEHLVQWGSGVPLLVLVGARPELREMRSSLTVPGGLVSEVITLAGLDAGAAMRLAANVIGAADLPASVAAKVLAASEGNPLFVGELVRMLVHEGALRKEGDRWTAGTALAALEMPPTIHALLAARIERLRPEERSVLERAAVIGRHFSRSAVTDLLARDATDLDARLESLRRSELIERDSGWFFGEPGLRFHHVLIRDAAYRRILKGTRAELHARFADWIEARAGDSLEHDETIGWHLEQAHQLLRELGPIDARGRALGERAAARLSAAGRRALARDDVSLAAGLLGRALDRLDRDDAARAELALDWCEALLAAGDVGPAAAALEELDRFAANDARLRAWHTCFAGQLTSLTAPQGLNEAAEAVANAARDLAALGDIAGEAKAHFVHAQAFMRLGKVGACEASLDRALAAARRADDRRRANTVLAIAPLAALWGPSPVTRASGRCLDVVRVLRITQGAPAVEAVALSCQGVLEALRGRTDAARRMIASARKMVEELGITQRLLEADVFSARIDLLDGDAVAAERRLRAAYEGMRELGLAIDAARAAALLARALLALDRATEAEALTHESERLAGDDLQAAIAWRGARAEALARRGETVEAVALASDAVGIAAATDALLDHADARLALAAALRAAGRSSDADTEERRATELWEAKGATLLAERARRESPRPAQPAALPEVRLAAARPARHRVRASRAIASAARFEAAVAAREVAALERAFSDPCVVVHHATGVTFGRREQLSAWKSILRAEHATYRREVLATLGESLELWRHWISISGLEHASVASFGSSEFEEIVIGEDDGQGRYRRIEIFQAHQLGQAIARLYERHAELLPDDHERSRAVGVSRTVRVMLGQPDLAATSTVLAPDVEFSDLRTVGFGTLRGVESVLQTIAAMLDLSRDDSARIDDVLALSHDALVVRWTNRGTHVESGGAFERNLCQLFTFDSAGLLSRWQQFEAEHDDAALARFDALVGGEETEPTPERFENAASRIDGELFRRFNARDWEGVLALAAAELVFDERRRMVRNTCGREVWLAQFRFLFDVPASRFTTKLLATRGERLSLNLHCFEGVVADGGGPLAMDDHLALHEVDREGRIIAIVLFDQGDGDAAHAELDARFDAGDGAAHARLVARIRARERAFANRDWDAWVALVSPGFRYRDHRRLGWGTGDVPPGAQIVQALAELAPDVRQRCDHLRLCERGSLQQITYLGTRDGGAFEMEFVAVTEIDAQGKMLCNDTYDVDRFDLALARFDELRAVTPPQHPFANAASRSVERNARCWAARDWEGALALLSPELRFDDRRRMMRLEIGYEDFVAQFRMLFDQPASRWQDPLLATRGERLSLHRTLFEAEVACDGGALEFDEHLSLTEVDAHGRWLVAVTFDLDDENAARAELDARYEAGEDRARAVHRTFMRAFARAAETRDWGPVLELCSPALVEHDHRRLAVLGTTRGAEAWVQNFRTLVELAPDSVYRVDHFRSSARGFCTAGIWQGTREGGSYELPLVAVIELDLQNRMARADIYDGDQLAEARARFDELATVARSRPRFENAATRVLDTLVACWFRRDWQRYEGLFAPNFRYSDRRPLVQLELDRDRFMAFVREIGDMALSRSSLEAVATRGERLALTRSWNEVAGGDVGPSEIDSLALFEVGVDGALLKFTRFDLDDSISAWAELDARHATAEAAAHPSALASTLARRRALDARDWGALESLCAPDVVCHDHRLLGWGKLHGVAAWLRTQQVLIELAPDARWRNDHVAISEHGDFQSSLLYGTRDGGPFELPFLRVSEIDASGKVRRIDLYDFDQVDQARARFEELESAQAPPPLARFENLASRRWREVVDAWSRRDFERFARLHPLELRYRDHRRMFHLDLDRERFLEFSRPLLEMGTAGTSLELLATRGERLALFSQTMEMASDDVGPSAIDSLMVVETAETGEINAYERFDLDNLDPAYAELDGRYEAGEGAARSRAWRADGAFIRALTNRDWEGAVALCARDFIEYDHRGLAVLGTTRGAEDWVRNFRTLIELAPDTRFRTEHFRAATRGFCTLGRFHGSREGGEYEMPLAVVVELDDQDRFARADIYDPEQLEQALARFEELRPGPLRITPNAAARLSDQAALAIAAGDRESLRAFASSDFRFEDRGKRALVTGDVGVWLDSALFLGSEHRARLQPELLATIGDRIAVYRDAWSGTTLGGGFELGGIRIFEVDDKGGLRALILFDLDDRAAAFAEAISRFASGEASDSVAVKLLAAFLRAENERDWNTLRGLYTPDLVVRDHRPLGLGVLDLDTWVASLRATVELSVGVAFEVFRVLAWNDRSVVATLRRHGSIPDGGGPFENFPIGLTVNRGDRIARYELFEETEAERAIARFEALTQA